MVQQLLFINLFFVPLVPLYILYRNRQKPLEPNLDLLFQYGIIAACNVPLTKVFVVLIRKIIGISISMGSGSYTLAALVPTITVILLYEFCRTYPDHKPWRGKFVQKGIKGVARDLAPACILLFVSCFMLFIFEPVLMYATNMDDFWFDFRIMIWPVLLIFARFFLIGIVIIFAVYNADLLLSKRLLLYKGITLIGFMLFFLVYLQGNWLAGSLPVLEGGEIEWGSIGKLENLILTAAAVLLAAATIAFVRKWGLNRTVSRAAVCSLVVFAMLFVSLIPTVVVNKALAPRDSFLPTVKNYNTISSNKNFLIFLVDAADSKMFYDVMTADPDFSEMMEDFTYYPDTLSMYPFTRSSIPQFLTGTTYHNEPDFLNYSSNAYNQSPLFEKLAQNGYGINLYSHLIYWGGELNYNIENSESIYDSSIDLENFVEQELKYVEFKYLPYSLKHLSRIETLDFDNSRVDGSEDAAYQRDNKINYEYIMGNGTLDKRSENYFQFIHCEGGHIPFDMDKDLNPVEKGSYAQKVAASLTLVKAYLQRLKDNGAYDNSAIVIMADHGYYNNSDYEELPADYGIFARCNPALFIKGINEKHAMLESDCPVSYEDLPNAFCDLLDGKQSAELFTDLKPSRTRTVFWQSSADRYRSMFEYTTTGTARELDKFTPTGNAYYLEG